MVASPVCVSGALTHSRARGHVFCALLARQSNPYTLRPTPMTKPPPQRTGAQEIFLDEDLDDRDYANRLLPRSAYRSPTVGSVTLWVIALNVVVFIGDRTLRALNVGYVINIEN